MKALLLFTFGISFSKDILPRQFKLAPKNCIGTWFHVEKQLLVMSFLIKFIPHCVSFFGNRNDLKGMANSAVQYPLNILVAEYHFVSQSKESLFTSTIPSICAP